ncbi:hypothetical protein PISMIDRAFT_680023 [Pisolithus microcarpus 441]|uniref:Uncharacterized protein n=1 Tax=Pisolithus microcarpus 441 TaxID=765257 RepID=A0A0C9YCT1_9AGAM|nr:hypothetical protein BKA83DRAFT_680023 [Pisolithus microcarpus]KIK22620.1 hypothetical protein PISMIDRAFT_680023 [Pisolithus microcarpus 441]
MRLERMQINYLKDILPSCGSERCLRNAVQTLCMLSLNKCWADECYKLRSGLPKCLSEAKENSSVFEAYRCRAKDSPSVKPPH